MALSEPLSVRPTCLVLHGLGGGTYELEPILQALKAEGLEVVAPTLPGHEGPGPVMPASTWQQWAEAAASEFSQLEARGKPVVIVGFSTGATLALHLATTRNVARMALLAPFLAIRYSGLVPLRPASYLRHLAQVIPDLPRRPPAVRDREMRKQAASIDRFRTFNLHSAVSALDLIDQIKPEVPTIKTPTLIIQGKLDTVVEPANAAWLYHHLGSDLKALAWMAQSDHLVALDHDRAEVARLTLDLVLGRTESLGQLDRPS